jgi:hypothetical protein
MAYTENPQSRVLNFLKVVFELYILGRVVKATQVLPASASNATTLDCAKGDVWTYTVTEDTTITPINLAPGQRVTLIVQATATSRTLTFGSPFKKTGTLVTGTASALFVIEFVSDGTNLCESNRTAALS